jgi:cation-dependent mannose-6-phosphate receptor
MRHSLLFIPLSVLFSLIPSSALATNSEKPLEPCTIISPLTGAFYDLNTITVQPSKDDGDKSWHARGYDYGKNFTLNFCAPVIEKLEHVIDVPESLWKNVSAYYKDGESEISIGQASSKPVFRGRKLVLNYTEGSYCEEKPKSSKPDQTRRQKSSLISFICDHDSLAPKVHITFVGASPDECTYFFEAKSMAACGGASVAPQTLGPAGVFGVIFLIAAAVYLFGGIAYQRTVMHQRGWRQLPNYAIWAGIGSFLNVSLPSYPLPSPPLSYTPN